MMHREGKKSRANRAWLSFASRSAGRLIVCPPHAVGPALDLLRRTTRNVWHSSHAGQLSSGCTSGGWRHACRCSLF